MLGKRAIKPDEYEDTETQGRRDKKGRGGDTLCQMRVAHSIK